MTVTSGRVRLDLTSDVVTLTAALCDIASVSHEEKELADEIERALAGLGHLGVTRIGNTLVARTELGRAERVVLAGHIDTVPLTDPPNLPTRRDGDNLVGRGTVDMKGGVAVQLRLAATLPAPNRDITFIFYEGEEVESRHNGIGFIHTMRPDLLEADFAVLLEPTNAIVEGGCKGTLRVAVTAHGIASHSARPWKGKNAIHGAGEILARLTAYEPRRPTVDGLTYREALNAVGIEGGIAGNVIPDRCVVRINYRYAPDLSPDEAIAHMHEVFDGFDIEVEDNAPGARPGLDRPAARAFVAALGVEVVAKEGWTDVARFSALGVPAVNFGPGDPSLAHTDDEHCPVADIVNTEAALVRWLS